MAYLKNKEIMTSFHYIPLHSSKAGIQFGEFVGNDLNTTIESGRLLRLPMYYSLKEDQVERVCELISLFYS